MSGPLETEIDEFIKRELAGDPLALSFATGETSIEDLRERFEAGGPNAILIAILPVLARAINAQRAALLRLAAEIDQLNADA